MRSIMGIFAVCLLFIFVAFLTPELVSRTVGASGFGAIDAIVNYIPHIVLGSIIGLFGLIIYNRSRD